MRNIETVYFDWGGVLIYNPAEGIVDYCCNELDCDRGDYLRAYGEVEFLFYSGKISEDELWRKVCGRLGTEVPKTRSLWTDAFKASYKPIETMFEIARQLKQNGINVGLLTNTEPPCKAFTKDERFGCFDYFVFSFEAGFAKPEAEIYHHAAQVADTPIEKILFVDDKPENTQAAEKVGMQAITFTDVNEFKQMVDGLIG